MRHPGSPEVHSDSAIAGSPVSLGTKRRRHQRLLVLVVVVFAALAAIGLWQAVISPVDHQATILVGPSGSSATPIALPNIRQPSKVIALSSFRGKPVVVNFWASWCTPCRAEMPLLQSAAKAQGPGMVFFGVDTNDTRGAALAFLARVGVTYPSVYDPHGTAANRYGLFGLPVTVFISRNGTVVGRHIGELHADSLRLAIEDMLKKP